MHFRWHPDAQLEADEAAKFYWERQPGLEQRFLDILEDALHRILRRPQMYLQVGGDIHKCKLPRFPYGVTYRTKPDTIEILAIMHLRRELWYWKSRAQ